MERFMQQKDFCLVANWPCLAGSMEGVVFYEIPFGQKREQLIEFAVPHALQSVSLIELGVPLSLWDELFTKRKVVPIDLGVPLVYYDVLPINMGVLVVL